MSERISSFKDVYKLAFELQQDFFAVSKRFPVVECYSLTDQIRRSSRSIGAKISEAWQKRPYIAHFVSKLTDADGSKLKRSIGWTQGLASIYWGQRKKRCLRGAHGLVGCSERAGRS